MRRIVRLLVLSMVAASSLAAIPDIPDHTALWSTFNSVYLRDSFAVATANDGLAVLKRDPGTGKYSAVRHTFLVAEPISHKISDNVMAVRTVGDLIVFIDMGNLPDLTVLGFADVGGEIFDYAFIDQSLYIARGFDGLWRYQMTNYGNAQFADSSMRGVHVVRCDIQGGELLALDDYNGVIRYRLSGTGFGDFEEYLWSPRQVTRFVRQDSLVIMTLKQDKMLYRGVCRETEAVMTDSIPLVTIPDRIIMRDSLVFTFEELRSIAELVDLKTGSSSPVLVSGGPDNRFQGVLEPRDNALWGIFPANNGGLYGYDLTNPAEFEPKQLYDRPGQIRGIEFFDRYLWVGGIGNPLDRYWAPVTDSLTYASTSQPTLTVLHDIARVDSALYVLYPGYNVVTLYDYDTLGHLQGNGTMLLEGATASRLLPTPFKIEELQLLFAIRERAVDLYGTVELSRNSFETTLKRTVTIGWPIITAAFDGRLLYVSNAKGLNIYQVFTDFSIELSSQIVYSSEITGLLPWKGRLLAFTGNKMLAYDMSDPFFPRLVEERAVPMPVTDIAIDGAFLYTVGPLGMAVYDSRPALPRLIDFGGRGGSYITARDGEVAISDGTSMHLFELHYVPTAVDDQPENLPDGYVLDQNFPNPFNPSTVITYSLPRQSDIRLVVFNILGQEVAVLADGTYPAGDYRIEWTGTDRSGSPVASGVYLYRLETESFRASRKMILIR